jgi:hypothetical protein
LHHFFEAQVRNQFRAIENVFVQRTCPSKKRDLLRSRKLLPQMPSGWSGPATLAKKVLAMDRVKVNTFFIAFARALAGTSGTGENAHHLHKTFYRSPCALACVRSSGYFT